MKPRKYKEKYEKLSARVGDNTRALAFAGIAVIWVFRQDRPAPTIPPKLLMSLLCFVGALAADYLQYIVGTLVWRWHYDRLEEKFPDIDAAPDQKHDAWLPIPQWIFFYVKVATLVYGYSVLIEALWSKLM